MGTRLTFKTFGPPCIYETAEATNFKFDELIMCTTVIKNTNYATSITVCQSYHDDRLGHGTLS